MVFSYEDKIRKRIYQGIVLAGLISAPFTKGVGLVATFGGLMASRKYNTVLQTPEERFEEKHYELNERYVKNLENNEMIINNAKKVLACAQNNNLSNLERITLEKNKFYFYDNLLKFTERRDEI